MEAAFGEVRRSGGVAAALRTPQVDRERVARGPVASRGDVAVAGGDGDALLPARDGVGVVERQAGVGAATGPPGPQLDALGAAGLGPLDDERIGGRQAGVKADHRLVDAPADADRAHAVAEQARLHPARGERGGAARRYGDAVGAGAVE